VRIARIAQSNGSGDVLLARIEADGRAVPIGVEDPAPGADPLRRLLAAGFDASTPVGDDVAADAYRLLCPVRAPQKVLAIGLNYRDHARESGAELPKAPLLFAKTPNSLVGPDEPLSWAAADTSEVDYEAELAVIIGTAARRVGIASALDHVFGYTACNDVSARDAQFGDGQWTRGKSFDTFCPLGPVIVTADEIRDPQALGIRCRVNGETLQDGTTADMVFGVAELISRLSQVMTLEPGDVIATGTPVGVGFARTPPVFLRDGDVVEIDIDGIGVLRNPVSVAS
jgi:2-keto-4-pentenoate hydratase/2-oxohepta-3-ene-1,7-dioic acid hydratase in catechol pathway